MAWLKGADIVGLKNIFKSLDPEKESAFLHQLSVDLRKDYHSIIASSKVPIEKMAIFYQTAADTVFPEDDQKIIRIGEWMSAHSLSTIYKIFVRIPTQKYIISRAPMTWSSYHEKGKALVENITETSGEFVVRDYPELPRVLRLAAGGHLMSGIKLSGGKNIRVKHDERDPMVWRWYVSWGL